MTTEHTERRRIPSPGRLLAVGQTTGGVAHDFNNVLNTIVTRASLIRARSSDPEITEHARAILDAAEVAREVTDRIRRILSPSPSGGSVRVSSRELLERTRELVEPRAALAGSRMEIDPGEAADVEGVLGELVQLIVNLANNAIDAAGHGGLVRLRASSRASEVVFEVEDDGPGIPLDLVDRVFEPFVSTKGDAGTGLGLALCRSIAESHGGAIALVPAPGDRGTVARVRLPCAGAGARVERRRTGLDLTARTPSAKVLLVDDDDSSLEALAVLLQTAGFEVITAGSVTSAMERFLSRAPSLVVTDIGLGGENGWTLVQRIRARDALIPIVVVSGDVTTSTAAEHTRWGVEAVLRKPINPGSLVNLLRQLAEAQRAFAARVAK